MKRQHQDISPRELDSAAIKKLLIDRDLSVTALAAKIGKSRVATSGGIHRPQRFPEARRKILKELVRG